ncbi:hypothetical protein C8J57DRAFT_1254246 [Mycena rebaudengoi]|nr:hypothetical protein C8J57DRAFT_1254246 [Mycena rebaudengoi]
MKKGKRVRDDSEPEIGRGRKYVAALGEAFLANQPVAGELQPPTIPADLGNLPGDVYIEAALDYIQTYPFTRNFTLYKPKSETGYPFTPSPEWRQRARAYLVACVKVDRSGLAAIADVNPPYDAELEQQKFIHEILFKRRWALEELASGDDCVSSTGTPSAVSTPTTTGEPRNKTVADHVRDRDRNCRMSSISPEKKFMTDEDLIRVRNSEVRFGSLEVAHGLPFAMGQTAFAFVTSLTGIPCNWKADCRKRNSLTCSTT